MKPGYTAEIHAADEGGFWATCPEVPGTNGQGETIEKATLSLIQAIEFLTKDQKLDALIGRITPENIHPEIEFGKSVGNEIL